MRTGAFFDRQIDSLVTKFYDFSANLAQTKVKGWTQLETSQSWTQQWQLPICRLSEGANAEIPSYCIVPSLVRNSKIT